MGERDERLVADRYRLLEPLGHGGMADVYVARDETLDREVAVKILRSTYLDDDTFLERFRREARSAARLNHRSIVSVHDTGDDDGVPFIVMELVPGRSLDRILDERGALPVGSALAIAAEVCDALGYAHERGVVHRDIKPGNIIVVEEGPQPQVKVADFGIARAAGDDTITLTSVLGTASYLSPEQAKGERADHRADLYALGIVLYELLSGAPPYSGSTAVQVALRHVGGDPEPPSRHADEVSDDLDAVVLTALAKDPDDRYRSAREFGRDLEALLADEPVSVDRAAALAGAAGLAGGEPTLRLDDDDTLAAPVEGDTARIGGAEPNGDGEPRDPARRRGAIAGLIVLALLAMIALFASREPGGPDAPPTPSTPAVQTPTTPPAPDEEEDGGEGEDGDGGGEDRDDGGGGERDDGRGPPPDRGPPDDRDRGN